MPTDQLSQTFAALADPTRREILARLFEGPKTVNELASPFEISLPAVSRHLKVLERAGLITRDRDAQYRPSTLRVEPLKEADGVDGALPRAVGGPDGPARHPPREPHARKDSDDA